MFFIFFQLVDELMKPACAVIKLMQCTMAKAFSIVLEKKATIMLIYAP